MRAQAARGGAAGLGSSEKQVILSKNNLQSIKESKFDYQENERHQPDGEAAVTSANCLSPNTTSGRGSAENSEALQPGAVGHNQFGGAGGGNRETLLGYANQDASYATQPAEEVLIESEMQPSLAV